MERSFIQEIFDKGKEEKVLVQGFVHEIRNQSKIKFILVRDFTGIIQCVAFKGETDEKVLEGIAKIPRESVIEILGKVKKSKQAPGGFEIVIEGYNVFTEAEDIPIHVVEKQEEADLSKRLDNRCIDLRKPKNRAIFKIQSALLQGMQEYLNSQGYIQVFTPSLMGVPSESGSEVFEVKFFGKPAFLRQDPQLHRQLAILGGLEKIYDIGPSWRAEKSHTPRHLTEHRTIAVETAFIKDEHDTMKLEEQVIIAAIKKVVDTCQKELELLGLNNKIKIPKVPFPEIKFPDVYKILGKKGKELYGEDLDREAEKMIWDYVQKKYPGCDFYFFNGFPHKVKPFYVMEGHEDNKEWARSVDLNFRGMEMSSGGQREHRYDKLMKNVKEKKQSKESVEWFTKFFKYGAPPHGGFSIGIERLTAVLLGIENIRETCLFPRDTERLVP